MILIMNQSAYIPCGKSIYFSAKLEHHGLIADDRALKNGEKHCMITHECYVIPLNVCPGLVTSEMQPPTDSELYITEPNA